MDRDQEKVYVDVLVESLEQKLKAMQQLMTYTKDQQEVLAQTEPDMEEFERLFDLKAIYLQRMEEFDAGFQRIYQQVSAEVSKNRYLYQDKILRMQSCIKEITELGVRIQAVEADNKKKFEQYVAREKKGIKSFKVSNKTAASYYKNMANVPQAGESYFLNSKQ